MSITCLEILITCIHYFTWTSIDIELTLLILKYTGPFGLVAGMMDTRSQKVGTSFADALRNHLYSPHDGVPGLDLFAINIQRGDYSN